MFFNSLECKIWDKRVSNVYWTAYYTIPKEHFFPKTFLLTEDDILLNLIYDWLSNMSGRTGFSTAWIVMFSTCNGYEVPPNIVKLLNLYIYRCEQMTIYCWDNCFNYVPKFTSGEGLNHTPLSRYKHCVPDQRVLTRYYLYWT